MSNQSGDRDRVSSIRITTAGLVLSARLELDHAPQTCEAFLRLLPWKQKLLHVRWSGEGCWVPLGNLSLGVGFANATSYPLPGQILLYPGGYSETELILAYGSVRFSSALGQLGGNHFLTMDADRDQLRHLGTICLWEGAQDVLFENGG